MAYRTTYLFIPRNGFLCPHSSGVYLFHPLDITKTSRSLEALRLQPLGRTTAVFYILESSSTHHFVKLFLAILRSDYQKATMEVL